ncbi:MAG: gamma-glutamyltransferase [Acidobacteria bacterium]|nr:gamma-glutamyltransferase [Acidobacteriota bacterium]
MRRPVLIVLTLGLLIMTALPQPPRVIDHYRVLLNQLEQEGLPRLSSKGMVSTAEPHATVAGVAALRAGGTAVDAAVAAAFALAVTYPNAGNLGGGGFLLHVPASGGTPAVFDFRETAPAAASRTMYLDPAGRYIPDSSTEGFRAAGVPGTVRGLHAAWQRAGRLPWAALLEPAIALAAEGFPVSADLARRLAAEATRLSAHPATTAIFFRDGRPLGEGEHLVQRDLAATLRRIAAGGEAEFYSGETAERLAAESTRHGGLITRDDLRAYRVAMRQPLAFRFRDFEIVTMPLPGGGVVLAEILQILEPYALARLPEPVYLQLLAEAMRLAYADRANRMGDPDHVSDPTAELLAPAHIDRLRLLIKPGVALDSRFFLPGAAAPQPESTETTHLSVVDAAGHAVSLTYTLNENFGCGAVVAGLGFLLNNEMDDFASAPGLPNTLRLIQGEANAIAPGKRPLSSMTPVVARRGGRPVLVLGSPGGPTIATAVAQVLLNVLEFGLDLDAAVQRSRIHQQWLPDVLYHEPATLAEPVRQVLAGMGYDLKPYTRSGRLGLVECVAVEWDAAGRPVMRGASDPRGTGLAAGF